MFLTILNGQKKILFQLDLDEVLGAGSLVAYCLDITDLDPIEFDLIFERFLNPDRISMPDFDIDFCEEQRDKVFEYLKKI